MKKNQKRVPVKKGVKTITGVYNPARSGDFGFVDVEAEEKGYFVYHLNRKDALAGDKVLAEVKEFKGKQEAKIIRVLERSDTVFIGEFLPGKKDNSKKGKAGEERFTYGFVVVKDEAFKNDIFIPGKYIGEAKRGDIVGVKIIGWSSKSPEGKIVEVVGKKGDKGLDVNSFILGAGFKQKFSAGVESELKQMSEKVSEKELNKRKDLRNLLTFTIDGADSKDLDDAISLVERNNGNFELFVHIADVAHYVREGSHLDKSAYKRGTSVYLADRVLPMLPEKLSNNLCSLNPNTDKLSVTCEVLMGRNGQIKKYKVYESVINSDFRLTYKEVDEMNFGDKKVGDELMFGGKITQELLETIKKSEELRGYIEKNKKINGVLNFAFPETRIELDEDKNPLSIEEYPRYKSNKIIEEFMITANEAVSMKFDKYPFLHRIHPNPAESDIYKLQETLNLFGVKFNLENFTTREFSDLLKVIDDSPKKHVLENIILRTLSKAVYSNVNEGHFGLGLNFYSHFTSPIRRYPDLQIHRIIKEKLNNKLDKKRIIHYKNILQTVAFDTSNQERKAEKLEYKVRDFYIVKYYKDKVGQEFEATIVSMLPKGIFVQLEDTAEGFVELGNKIGFFHREDLMMFQDRGAGIDYSLGDKIKVKLIEADEENIRLNFELA